MPIDISHSPPTMVRRIFVERLFGDCSYDLYPDGADDGSLVPQVLLLYGDNGSGKTTIAQLLYHLLSQKDQCGHRTFLALTIFKRFGVESTNGTTIIAERHGDNIVGPYDIVANDPRDGRWARVPVRVNERGHVGNAEVDEHALKFAFEVFATPQISTFFLSDNRVLQSDEFERESRDRSAGFRRYVTDNDEILESQILRTRHSTLAVKPSIARAEAWMRHQAITASNIGEENISTIYSDIITRVSQSDASDTGAGAEQYDSFVRSLYELSERSERFAALGMGPKVPIAIIGETLRCAEESRQMLLTRVLEPYVNGLRARFNVLTDIQVRLTTFLEIINAFYRRKSVRITLQDGIEVLTDNGSRLDPMVLSSGEKQLMLLLCNVLVATNRPTVFIIDEPELSLNIKWKRKLVDSLLRLVEGSAVQFIMATHSIELLSQHRQSVLDLNAPEKG